MMIVQFLILALSSLLVKSNGQYVSSDQVFVNDIELVSYDNPLTQSTTQQISLTVQLQVNFQNIPKIIVGFKHIDFDYNSNQKSFEMVLSNISTNNFQIQFIKYDDTKVYRIIATYVAIDSQYVYQNKATLNFQPWPANNQITVSKEFSNKSIDTNKVQRKVIGFIQGTISNTYSQTKLYNIKTNILINTNSIDITAIQNDPQQSLSQINVNYLEFYVNITNPYYDVNIFVDPTYLTDSNFKIGIYPSKTTLDFNYLMDMKAVAISLSSYNIPLNTFSARLNTTLISYNPATKFLDFQYQIWVDSVSYSFGATIAAIKMVDCSVNQNTPINYSEIQQCVSQCPLGYIQQKRDPSQTFSFCQKNICSADKCLLCNSNNSCVKCEQSMYLFNLKCYITQPPKTFCDNQLNCQSCQAQCLTCTDGNSCSTCLNAYQFKGICYQNKPNNTYCDQNMVCTQCQDSQCSNCNSQNLCISCGIQNPFYYQNQCYPVKQQSTYCDQSNICFPCHPLCQECIGPNSNQCTKCQSNYVLSDQKCKCPLNGYGQDPVTLSCIKCSINLCSDCYGDNTQCQQCSPESMLNPSNNKCECSDPLYYYDSFFQKCKQNSITNCKISSKNLDKCIQCQNGFFLNQNTGQCGYCENNTYADNQNICRLKCRLRCQICINNKDCISEVILNKNNLNSNSNNNSGQISNCHYSCDKCSQPNSANSCLTCAPSSNRGYDPQSFKCQCKSNYLDEGTSECSELVDLDSSIFNYFQVSFYVSFAFQIIFAFGISSTNYQNVIIIQQYIFLLTLNPSLNKSSNFYKLLALFRYLSIFHLFENVQLISKISYSLNILLIFTSVLVFSILIACIFHFACFSFAYSSYFKWNLVFLTSRILSLYSFLLIFNIFFKQQMYTDPFTLSIVLIYLFFYIIKTILHFKGIIRNAELQNSQDILLNNSINLKKNINLKSLSEISMEKPQQQTPIQKLQKVEIEMIQNFTQQQALYQIKNKRQFLSPYQALFCELDLQVKFSKYFWLFVEFKNLIVGFLIGYFGDNNSVYYILPSFSFISILIHSFNKPQTDQKKRNLVFYIESLVLIILVFFCFYVSKENKQSDQSKIMILVISCCIFIISISIVIFHLAIILDYIKDKLDSKNNLKLQAQNQLNNPQSSMRMQNYFTKDQISAILDQPSYFSNSTSNRSKRRYHF